MSYEIITAEITEEDESVVVTANIDEENVTVSVSDSYEHVIMPDELRHDNTGGYDYMGVADNGSLETEEILMLL